MLLVRVTGSHTGTALRKQRYNNEPVTDRSVVGPVAEWLACWTQAQKGPGSNRSRDAVG